MRFLPGVQCPPCKHPLYNPQQEVTIPKQEPIVLVPDVAEADFVLCARGKDGTKTRMISKVITALPATAVDDVKYVLGKDISTDFTLLNLYKSLTIMKKIFVFLLTMICCNIIIGQTYFYEFECFVDSETGVKRGSSSPSDLHKYITFTNNKSICYFSDEKGNATGKEHNYYSFSIYSLKSEILDGGVKYYYKGIENGSYKYEAITTYSTMYRKYSIYDTREDGLYHKIYDKKKYLYFNSDYTRANEWEDPYYYVYNAPQTSQLARSDIEMYRKMNNQKRQSSITVYNKAVSPEERKKSPSTFY